jgi:hypothetical protein
MIGRASGILRSKRAQGFVWLVAALPMIAVPILNDGNRSIVAIGLMFLVFGMVSLRRN